MRVLGLDGGGTTGYALGACGSRKPVFGVIRLPGGSALPSKKFVVLEGRVRELIVTGEIDRAYVELPFLQRDEEKLNITRERLAWGYQAAIGMACEKEGIQVFPIESAKWRSFFLGVTQAPREIGEGLSSSARLTARRSWLKAKAMEVCRRRGWDPPQEDAAEAGGIWDWGCEHAVAGSTLNSKPLFAMLDL